MDLEFSSQEELFSRVRPALNAKVRELNRLGYRNILDIDIWNYLKETKWIKSHDLALCDIVNDILRSNNKRLFDYVQIKRRKLSQDFDRNLDILWGEVYE